LIFAWGLTDPDPTTNYNITFHRNQRGSRIVSLLSYAEPQSEATYAGLDTFEFLVNVSDLIV
jgi:hypothetical protein